jgi:hypothetical protein
MAVIGVALFVAAAVVIEYGTLWGLAVVAAILTAAGAMFLFTDLFSE